ncbi:septum formation family protein [Arthrobacter sp. K5]|jgi:hypothetical protein|uniref:Septum formation family protein n=1 Tax=Arthrobacter sp. K5 TaxID=2839623 RepID=A0AAU8EJG7_9MICC
MNDNDPSHDGERGTVRSVTVQPEPAEAQSAGCEPAEPKPVTPESAGPDRTQPSAARPGTARPGAAQAIAARLKSLLGSIRSRLAQTEVRQTLLKAGFVVALLVVGGLLVWLLTSLLASATMQAANRPEATAAQSSPAAPAVSPRPSLPLANVGPLDFRVGDCFKDFDPEASKSTVVACTSDHSAQLVAVTHYADGDAYPGREGLKTRARETCQTAALTEKSNAYNLNYRLAYPSTASWAKGDRRVDCYVTASGNVIKASLLP